MRGKHDQMPDFFVLKNNLTETKANVILERVNKASQKMAALWKVASFSRCLAEATSSDFYHANNKQKLPKSYQTDFRSGNDDVSQHRVLDVRFVPKSRRVHKPVSYGDHNFKGLIGQP